MPSASAKLPIYCPLTLIPVWAAVGQFSKEVVALSRKLERSISVKLLIARVKPNVLAIEEDYLLLLILLLYLVKERQLHPLFGLVVEKRSGVEDDEVELVS